MKKVALVGFVLGLVVVVGGVIGVSAKEAANQASVAQNPKVTRAQAREIALKRVPGKVVEEMVIDDEKGKVVFYAVIIKQTEKKQWEVMVNAETGEIISVEEYEEEADDPQTAS